MECLVKRKGVNHLANPSIIMAGPMGLEPTASGVTGRRYNQLNYDPAISITENGRRNRDRTCDIHGVSVALSQLSYPPVLFFYLINFLVSCQEKIKKSISDIIAGD
jgi:hypothetical protein